MMFEFANLTKKYKIAGLPIIEKINVGKKLSLDGDL